MQIDKYTKIILTVIAVNLTILSFSRLDIIPEAIAGKEHSATNPSEMQYGLVPLNENGTISATLSNSEEMDVNITGIDTWDEMEVKLEEISASEKINGNIEKINGHSIFSSELPVKIKD